ncbi:MAG: peptidylprolyl isomerase [Candidatus Fermentibacteraceae bacterium]
MNRISLFIFFTGLLVSCGGSPERLGSVAGQDITVDEFLETFNDLPPDRQVAVLEPGGRLELMRSMVTKKLLLAACDMTPAQDTDFWVDLYETAWLSDSITRSLAMAFDPEPVLAGLDSTVYSIHVVLLADSATARQVAATWRAAAPSDPGGSLLAPWSGGSGTSYRIMSGPPWQFTSAFRQLLDNRDVQVLPRYGAWLVGRALPTESKAVPDQNSGMSLFGWEVERVAGVTVDAPELNRFALYPSETEAETVLAFWNGGQLTTQEMARILERVSYRSFPDGVPPELSAFNRQATSADSITSLWFSVLSASRSMALAGIARSQGAGVPRSTIDYARTEALVRERVIIPAMPDSSQVALFYTETPERYSLPERRSVLLGYVEQSRVPQLQSAQDFSDLGEFNSMTDSFGNLIPTPLQPMEAFGAILGERVFSAPLGAFQGPIESGEELAAYFRVIAVAPPDTLPLETVYELVELDLFRSRFENFFTEFIDSLTLELGIEIDTTAVERVDPWAAAPGR